MSLIKFLLKTISVLLSLVIVAAIAILTYATLTEFKPDDVTELAITRAKSPASQYEKQLAKGDSLSLMTYNIGYGSLGAKQDFFMDGGKLVRPEKKEDVESNLNGIQSFLADYPDSILFMQEVDFNSKRSYGINEVRFLSESLAHTDYSYAQNFKVSYVPYPFPPIGKVDSGLVTFSPYRLNTAQRVSLPVPFKWPVRTVNLKRCYMINRLPIANSKQELVLVNFHLEAYDSGEGKVAQTKALFQFLEAEYAKGNYVIAGGDWNQVLPHEGGREYPILSENFWKPGKITQAELPQNWSVAIDPSNPTCRSTHTVYENHIDPFQYYLIDGFIMSPNIRLDKVQTIPCDFQYSDHDPVSVQITLLD